VTADDDRGCYDPVDPVLTPRLTPSLMLFNFEFDVTVFDVPVFDVTHLYLKNKAVFNLLQSCLRAASRAQYSKELHVILS
jgi:hypothetical protein